MDLKTFRERVEKRFWRSRIAQTYDAALAVAKEMSLEELITVVPGLSIGLGQVGILASEISTDAKLEDDLDRRIRRFIAAAMELYLNAIDSEIAEEDETRPGFKQR